VPSEVSLELRKIIIGLTPRFLEVSPRRLLGSSDGSTNSGFHVQNHGTNVFSAMAMCDASSQKHCLNLMVTFPAKMLKRRFFLVFFSAILTKKNECQSD